MALLLCGCRGGGTGATAVARATEPAPPPFQARFVDVADSVGVRFKHTNGASGRYYIAETMGSGCALLDYDGDGRLDLFLVNSGRLPGFGGKGPFYPALYHQKDDGTFEDVTRRAGLAVECYGVGCAVGDYDNDGDPDLYLTAFQRSILFRNDGRGRFTDVTRAAAVPGPAFGTCAAWFDYDRDGDLDLFAGNYCRWTPALNQRCGDSSGRYICGPKYYAGTPSILYRNNGNGTFSDVTRAAGVWQANGKALGIVFWDMNGDGWLDFAVANDTVPNWLFRNNRDGTFTEVGVEAGIAYANTGTARAGMGIDTVDYENSGQEALIVGNNSTEGLGLFRPEAPGHFSDVAEDLGVFEPSMPFTTFGALFVDVDLDGFPEIVTANGHVNEHVARLANWLGFEQQMQLYRNEPGGPPGTRRFRELGNAAGTGITTRRVARGLAAGDMDGDGDLDLLVNANNGRAALLRNEVLAPLAARSKDGPVLAASREPLAASATEGSSPHWLAVRLRGVRSNREGIGARVTVQAGGQKRTRWVRSGSSYCSDSEHVARFGLGAANQVELMEIRWPCGAVQTLRNVKPDRMLQITEPAS